MRDAGHRTPDAGHRTSDGEKSKNNISTPQGGGHNNVAVQMLHSPMKSAKTDSAPMHKPPNAAAVGMYRFNSWIIDFSRWPRITICCSFSCFATLDTNITF